MRPMMRKTGAVLAALSLTLGAAACGDDDEPEDEGATPAAEVDAEAFCDAFVQFNSDVFQTDVGEESTEAEVKEAGELLAPSFQTIADNAPEDLSEAADDLNASVQALLEGDGEKFGADETFESYTAFSSGAVESCEFPSVDVDAADYRFDGVPASIAAGTSAFSLTNTSEVEEHEIALLSKKDGESRSWDELLALPEEEAQGATEFHGAAFAPPGAEGATVAELEPGSYLAVCFIPVGGGEEGAPHFTQGMRTEFVVE